MKKSILIMILYLFILIGLLPHNSGKKLAKFKITNKNNAKAKVPRNLESDNYIVLYFNKDYTYSGGFQNSYRNDINYIINQKYPYKEYTNQNELDVHKGFGIEIHFNITIRSLYCFFDSYYDSNMKNLVFIDFSYFNSISLFNIGYLLAGCISLKSIDF